MRPHLGFLCPLALGAAQDVAPDVMVHPYRGRQNRDYNLYAVFMKRRVFKSLNHLQLRTR